MIMIKYSYSNGARELSDESHGFTCVPAIVHIIHMYIFEALDKVKHGKVSILYAM